MILNKDEIEEEILKKMADLAYSRYSSLIKKMIKKIRTMESKLTIKSEYYKKRLEKMLDYHNRFGIFIGDLEMFSSGEPNLGSGESKEFENEVNNNKLIRPTKIHTLNDLYKNYELNAYRFGNIIDEYISIYSRLESYITDLKKFKETVKSFDFRTLSKYTMKEFEQVFYKKNGLVIEFYN